MAGETTTTMTNALKENYGGGGRGKRSGVVTSILQGMTPRRKSRYSGSVREGAYGTSPEDRGAGGVGY